MILKIRNLHKTLIVLLIPFFSFSQPPGNYPKDYFGWPLQLAPDIVANFGELRPNHYHMGLDCRTDQQVNQPVYAAADGYISRVKVEPFGFGRAIYINHPNGFTSLYAHLNEFYPELENYVTEQQYILKSWAVSLVIPANMFRVSKAQFIAFSGNTGGSQGPHVHFEIRDTKTEKALNASLFGLPVPDTIPPAIYRLAVYDRNSSTYEQTPKLYPLKKINGVYKTSLPLITMNTDKVSFGITATDRCNASANANGIYEAYVVVDDLPLTGFRMDNIGYDETRYLNAHIDYKLRKNGGPYVQHLSALPGYNNGIYTTPGGKGLLLLADSSTRPVKIVVKDTEGNSSELQFEIRRNMTDTTNNKIPSMINDRRQWFAPGHINVFENDHILFYLPENAVYDSFRFTYSEQKTKQGGMVYQLHHTGIPVHSYFPLLIKPQTYIPGKMVMHHFSNGRHDYALAEPVRNGKEEGWFKASFRELGSFELLIDTLPPTITPIGFKNGMNSSKLKQLIFVITDNTEEIKKFTALLNGNWLRFSNDKGRRFVYVFDEHCPPGEHELVISADDQAGNTNTKTYKFTR
jgi:murein DD-endopeptidase MepM/ murein hydrolase activator NlpD